MVDSRTKNTKRNIVAGISYRFVAILFPFINRTLILWILGAEFTGLASLFTSILEVLNIAELGFNYAVVYSLYEPIAKNNYKRINELVSLIKQIYKYVGTFIFVVGLLITPFITKIINGSYPDSVNIYIIYLLYLINTGVSYYLYAYKEVLLIAFQRKDISDNIRTVINIIRYIAQFVTLYFTKDYYLFLIVSIVGTVVTNLLLQYETKKRYSFYESVKYKVSIPNSIKDQVKGLLIDRLSNVSRNSLSTLVVSSFLGLTATAIFGNYYYIYSSLYGFMLVICNAMAASVGNSIVVESKEKNFKDLQAFSALFAIFSGWCSFFLLCLYQPFMTIWAGSDLLLPFRDVVLFSIFLYVINMTSVRDQYIAGTGIWWKLKMSSVYEIIANAVLCITLGKLFGITGVLISMVLNIFIFNFVWRSVILFKEYFGILKIKSFILRHFFLLLIVVLVGILTYAICVSINFENEYYEFAWRLLICAVVPIIVFLLMGKRVGVIKESLNTFKQFFLRRS